MNEASLNLEKEIADIERTLSQKREALQQQKESGEIHEMPHEKETLHSVVREKFTQTTPTPAPTTTPSDDTTTDSTIPSYMRPELQSKVQFFVNDAFTNSIEEATQKVKEIKDAALLDAFHDAIVDQLFDKLVERGKLTKLD